MWLERCADAMSCPRNLTCSERAALSPLLPCNAEGLITALALVGVSLLLLPTCCGMLLCLCGAAELQKAVSNVKLSVTDVQSRIATLNTKVTQLTTDVSC